MNWKPPGKFAQLSQCERYSVCAIGSSTGRFYEAWRARAHEDGPHLVSTALKTAEDARNACQADSEEKP